MGIFGFGKKDKQNNQPQQQYFAAGDPVYNDIVQRLFTSYMINTYSHYLSNGGEKMQSNYTTMAKYQKCTFEEYCTFIKQGCDLASKGNFNQEQMQLANAASILSNGVNYDQDYLESCCAYVSTVYECSLALSQRSQQEALSKGQDPDKFELTHSQLKNNMETNFKEEEFAVISPDFVRGQNVCEGYQTVKNVKDTISSIESDSPDIIPWALDIAAKGTETADYIVYVMNKSFHTIQPDAAIQQ